MDNKMTADQAVATTGGKVSFLTLARLVEIHRDVPAKWARFVAGAKAQMGLTQAMLDAVVSYVEGDREQT